MLDLHKLLEKSSRLRLQSCPSLVRRQERWPIRWPPWRRSSKSGSRSRPPWTRFAITRRNARRSVSAPVAAAADGDDERQPYDEWRAGGFGGNPPARPRARDGLPGDEHPPAPHHGWGSVQLSKQLCRVKDDILNKVMLASFAINTHTTIVLLTIQAGGHRPHPPPRQPEDAAVGISHTSQSTDDSRSELNGMQTNLLAGNQGSIAVGIRKFKWPELKAATNGFSNGNLIGQGGDFIVYKGVLKDGSIVAIKKINKRWPRNYDKLLPVVSKLHYKNIVKFVGYGHEVLSTSGVQLFKRKKDQAKDSEFIWVEEYVPSGSLHEFINGSRDSQLDWSSIFRIIEGVAQGVQYLHEQRVLHKDVQPRNILLDSDMNPIITDFSISKALDDVDEMIETLEGTVGFIPPEHIEQGILSVKNDVFAFGMTLLMTVASMRRWPADSPWAELQEGRWAWKAWEAGRIEEEFDPSLFDGSHQLAEMKRCVEVGLLCTQRDREDRPTMADVLEMLHGHKELPIPKMPSWFQEDGYSSPL